MLSCLLSHTQPDPNPAERLCVVIGRHFPHEGRVQHQGLAEALRVPRVRSPTAATDLLLPPALNACVLLLIIQRAHAVQRHGRCVARAQCSFVTAISSHLVAFVCVRRPRLEGGRAAQEHAGVHRPQARSRFVPRSFLVWHVAGSSIQPRFGRACSRAAEVVLRLRGQAVKPRRAIKVV